MTGDGGRSREEEVGAEIQPGAGLDPDDSALTESGIDVVHGAGHGQHRLGQVDYLDQNLLPHGCHAQREQIGGGAHGLQRHAGGVREHGVCQAQRHRALVHLVDECGDRAGIPSSEGFRDVVA